MKKTKLIPTNKKRSYSLVIVESPSKTKKIESYLGAGYKCIASFGHIRQLTSLESIHTKNIFPVKYDMIEDANKKKHIDFLRKEIALAEEVILATDDDREGEAIAWHICDLFGLPVDSTKRILFHEITDSALQKAIRNPTTLNMSCFY